jgi:hypothetical protein
MLASVLKELVGPGGGEKPSDNVVLPPPTSAWEIRLSTIHRGTFMDCASVKSTELIGWAYWGSDEAFC